MMCPIHPLESFLRFDSEACGINDDCTLTVAYNRKRFLVKLSPNHDLDRPSTIEGPYLSRLDAALELKNDSEIDVILDEIQDLVAIACEPIFRQLAPVVIGDESQDLDTFLNPETFKFKLVTNDGKLEAIRVSDQDDGHWHIPTCEDLGLSASTIDTNLPKVLFPQITVMKNIQGDYVLKVSVAGEQRCCKLASEFKGDQLVHEVHCMQRLTEYNLSSSVRVPRCHGFVMTKDDNIVGILMDYIPETKVLSLLDIDAVVIDRRTKWARQIRNIIDELHKAEIVWGDAKAGNILIDSNDDAWVIDFGGSWTQGWVTRELAGTVEGDMQGLARILEYLKV